MQLKTINESENVQTLFENCDHITTPMYTSQQSLLESNLINEDANKDQISIIESQSNINLSYDCRKLFKNKRFRNSWGNLSYAHLIAAAILSSPRRKMKLNEIYNWFTTNIPYFSVREDETKSRGWKNSIRHNLSLKKEFIRESGDKKAGYWFIDQKTLLDRLKAENRQITDANYNRDMELFELYVQQVYSNFSPIIEDFISFSRRHMVDTAISGILDNFVGSEYNYVTTSDNPFFCLQNQYMYTSDFGSKRYPENINTFTNFPLLNNHLTFQNSNIKSCSESEKFVGISEISQNESLQKISNDLSSFKGFSSKNSKLQETPKSVNVGSISSVFNQTEVSSNDNFVIFSGLNKFINQEQNQTSNFNGSLIPNQQEMNQEFYNQDLSTQTNYISMNNYNVPLQQFDVYREFSNSQAYFQHTHCNAIDPSQIQRNNNGKYPVIVNGTWLLSDIPFQSLNVDSNQQPLIKM